MMFFTKRAAWAYIILIVSASLGALLAVKNIKISPDSIRYALISQQILSGNGISIPIVRLVTESGLIYDNIVPVNGTVPFLEQPPLLPILLAMLGGVTSESFLAAQILNVICHVAIAFFSFLLMKRIYENNNIALLTGILISTSLPILVMTHNIISEPLFIALTTATIYFLTLSRCTQDKQSGRNLIIGSICTSAAILTRFAGLSLIIVVLWEAVLFIRHHKSKFKYGFAITGITLPVLTTSILFLRNYIISGTIRGVHQPGPDRSFIDAFTGTIKMIFDQFQLGGRSLLVITAVVILLVIYIVTNSKSRKGLSQFLDSGLDLTLMFIVSYTALITVTMALKQPHFELRYISPLVPFLFIMSSFAIVFLCEQLKLLGFSKLSLYGMILSFSILSFGSLYKTYLNVPEFFYIQEKQYSILGSPTFNWIKENYEKDITITTNRPYHLSFFGGYPTVALTHKRFDPNIGIPDNMESVLLNRMYRFGSRVIALFDEVDQRYEGRYLAELFSKRQNHDKFILIHESESGVVYRLED